MVNVQAIIELAASYGPVPINRAYCSWQFFGRYRDALLQGAVELIQLFPPGQLAKNGADIKLCLDAAEDIARFPHIGTVLIVGGDSDFMPVAQKIKAGGRTLVNCWAGSASVLRPGREGSCLQPTQRPTPDGTSRTAALVPANGWCSSGPRRSSGCRAGGFP